MSTLRTQNRHRRQRWSQEDSNPCRIAVAAARNATLTEEHSDRDLLSY